MTFLDHTHQVTEPRRYKIEVVERPTYANCLRMEVNDATFQGFIECTYRATRVSMERNLYWNGWADGFTGQRQASDDPHYLAGWVEGRLSR